MSRWLAGYEAAWRTPGTGGLTGDLWVMRLVDDGRCSWFEEWPFWPEHTYAAQGGL